MLHLKTISKKKKNASAKKNMISETISYSYFDILTILTT